VRRALPAARYAHFATHGWFAPEATKSALAGGRDHQESGSVPGWHPLLLSGLALSDANRVPKDGEEDGILTALEVSEMDLTRLELAVLSACETGLGKVAGGEGVLGMQRAFQAAGARSVVASLWQVDDEATRRLMTDFYSQLWSRKDPVAKAEALRRAQLAMLFGKTLEGKPRGAGVKPEKLPKGEGARTPPYYWAAFVLSGDWR
ncbi:MAG: CHAT domain-containing protein, partial [Gemmataceae bacterium]|nr:CHAT domain-containing protein [Gemmataceae bacterium]